MFKTILYRTYWTEFRIELTAIVQNETNMVLFSHFPDECIEELEDAGVVFEEFKGEGDTANGPVTIKRSDYDTVIGYFNELKKVKINDKPTVEYLA